MAIQGKVLPGKNSQLYTDHLSDDQLTILNRLSSEWYITNGGGVINLGKSSYTYFLMMPTENYKELFNIDQEIIVLFSDYDTFESRTLDGFDAVYSKFNDLRIEKVCSILISKDALIQEKIKDLLKSDPEHQVIVPFHYNEILNYKNDYFIRQRFKEYFYNRDLFAFNSALKKDLYFYGRSDLIHELINRHRSNENSGLFGLRKTGKTSVIYGIKRAIQSQDGAAVILDCQSPSFHKRRWNNLLKYIIDEIKEQLKSKIKVNDENLYTEENATLIFEKDLLSLFRELRNRKILLVFDEIEQITPSISPTVHWREGEDFILFWQSLRYLFQKLDNTFTYLIVGTNPKCVETPHIQGFDNPIFNQIPYQYIQAFDVSQTREMVRKIGRIMGLKFDETIYSKLTDDYGGHPFLIRNVCSAINKIASKERPVRIDKSLYEEGKKLFNENYKSYIEMILFVLNKHYNDEFEMLKYLAMGDMKTFIELAELSSEYTNHLLGYNIIDKNGERYSFRIEAVKQYLIDLNKYKSINQTNNEKIAEISQRRNDLEPKLRSIVRKLLLAKYGEAEAKEKFLKVLNPSDKKLNALNLKDLFNPNISKIYYEDLRKIIAKEWEIFEFVFGQDKSRFNSDMEALNKYRADAHAKEISDEDMSYFRVCATRIEKFVETYLE